VHPRQFCTFQNKKDSMTIDEFKAKHTAIIKNQIKEGWMNKIIAFALIILSMIFVFFYVFGIPDEELQELSSSIKIVVISSTGLLAVTLLMLSDPLNFVFPTKMWDAKRNYKIDIFELIQSNVPEIKRYKPAEKINALEFYKSGISNEVFEDYNGDDWMELQYNNHRIILCDLKVTRLFKKVFQGLFVVCQDCDKSRNFTVKLITDDNCCCEFLSESTLDYIKKFCNNSPVCISQKNNTLYLTIDRTKNIFEMTNVKTIKSFEDEFVTFQENINLIKQVLTDILK
jgi:hypothetical protein